MNVQFTAGKFSARDNNDHAAVGYKLWSVAAGTSTASPSYSDPDCSVLNTNPVVLDARGEAFVYVNSNTDFYFTLPTATNISTPIWESQEVGEQQSDQWSADGTSDGYNNYAVTVTPTPLSIGERQVLIITPDADNKATLVIPTGKTSPTVFTGTGINDGLFSGPYVGSTAGSVFTVEIDSVAVGLDANMKLLLHGDGSGASFTDSSASVHGVTAHGGVTQDSGESKFGGNSILFTSAGDYLSCLDSADWNLSNNDFTLEAWVYFSSVADATFFAQTQTGGADANNTTYFDYKVSTHKLRFFARDASTTRADYDYVWTPTVSTWYHLAVVRSGSSLLLFIDGVLTSWTDTTTAISTSTLGNLTGLLTIGYGVQQGTNFLGYMDEVCWSNGVARWTATFTPATQAYGGTYDTFEWQKDGPSWNATGVPITGNNVKQILIEGVAISFAEITGHTVGDIWAVTVMTPARVNVDSLGGVLVYKNVGGTLQALEAGDMKDGIAATLVYNSGAACWVLNNPSTAAGVSYTTATPRPRKELITDYDLLQADAGDELSCTGTFTITLLAAPNFVNNFVDVKNIGTGNITIDGGVYNIVGDNTTTYILGPSQSMRLITNGTDWHILFITYSGGRVEYPTHGTYTWTVPGGVNFIKRIVCIGAGASGSNNPRSYCGGGGGVEVYGDYPVTPGQSITVVVGAGGAPETAGGDSSFDTLPVAHGGQAVDLTDNGPGGIANQTGSKYRVNQAKGFDGNNATYGGGPPGLNFAAASASTGNAPGGGGGGGNGYYGADGAVYISY